ncbi:hypothetical protein [Streptacidiphilus sp. EB103A]|uniref:hypothetical protein n=1 Tax=Streptacidiphilus sp. EB103A TaxID=3156275 RepID=UPI003517F327
MNPAEFQPTHVAPPEGLATWAGPDPSQPSTALDPLLPVQVLERRGDWTRVVCANGWAAWVDGRLLVALPRSPDGASQPLTAMTDPRPLLARLELALAAYRGLVDELVAGRLELEAFQRRAAGFRLGAVVDGTSAWLLDLDRDRWFYCDGTRLQPYATVEAPPAEASPAGTPHVTEPGEPG